MQQLDEKILEWRRQMLAGGINDKNILDELEGHLWDEVAGLVTSGKTEVEAFELAVSRMGNPGPLRKEFKLAGRDVFWPVAVGSWLWIAAMLAAAGCLLPTAFNGRRGLLLVAHILSVLAGYSAAFVAGSLAICHICCRTFRQLTPERRQSLAQAAYLFTRLAAGFVVLAVVLSMFWTREHFGKILDGNPQETLGLCATAWLIAVLAFQRFGRPREHASMLLFSAGNIVVGLAWFGRTIWADPGLYILPLMIFVGVHLVFLGMGLTPNRAEAPAEN